MPPHPAIDFESFVASQVQRLAQVADLLTGDRGEADQIMVDAFARLYRVWPTVARSRDPSAAARQRLLSAYGRTARRRARSQQEPALRLADEFGATAGPPRVIDVWETVLDLPPRQRAVLVLRLFEGLHDRVIARMLKTPAPLVGHHARRALEQVALTAGLTGADQISGQPDAEACDRVAEEVAACLHEHHRGDDDVEPLVARVRDAARDIDPHPSRRKPILVTGAVAVLVFASFVTPRWWPQQPGAPATLESVPVLPAAPAGTRLVGYANVVVAVPSDWEHNAVPCAGAIADSVIYPDAVDSGGCVLNPRSSTVTFTNPTSTAMYYSSIQPQQIDQIGGRRVLGTGLTRPNAAYEQTVIVPSSGFWMVVRSPQKSVVRKLVASIQVVPQGFTIVPSCRGQRLGDASADLVAAGLKPVITQASTLSERRGQPPVTYQNIDAGKIVPVGSSVGLSVPSF